MYTKYKLQKMISNICKNQYGCFLNKNNVLGIACGYKIKNGFCTKTLCIQVFVIKKIPKSKLSCEDIIPMYFKGIPTDIIETGEFNACALKKRIRPVLGGYSISSTLNQEFFGTTSCLVSNGVNNFILSSNHTIANENTLPIGSPIIQPASKYGGFHPNDTIGTLHRFVPLRFIDGTYEPINFSDAAIGLLNNPNILSNKIAFIGNLKGMKKPILDQQVKKVGAKTELTHGIVTGIDGTTRTTLTSGKRCLFQDIIATTLMSDKGDSGAVLVNDHNYAIGLLIARGNDFSIYSRIDIVLDQLDVHLVI